MDEPETPNPDDPRTFIRVFRPAESGDEPVNPMPTPTPNLPLPDPPSQVAWWAAGVGLVVLGVALGLAMGAMGKRRQNP